jgi:regulatory subunit for Cdc7p protein kinase
MRASAAALQGAKKSRTHAELLREEAYGQPPPAKRQMVERVVPSPTRPKTTRTIVHRSASRAAVGTGVAQKAPQTAAAYKPTEREMEQWQQWHTNTRAAFPRMVFYFESIHDEQRSKFAKQVAHLGAVSTHMDIAVLMGVEKLTRASSHSAKRSSSQSILPMSSLHGRSPP